MLYLSETPKSLLQAAGNELASICNVRARHWIIAGGRGPTDYILHHWAANAGIAAHSQEVELRDLIEQAAAGQGARFDFDQLRLTIAKSLADLSKHPHFPLPSDQPLTQVTASVLTWATSLATAIHEGLQCREPDNRWESGSFLESLVQHSPVQSLLHSHPGWLTDETFQTAALAWIQSWRTKGGLPHLWIVLHAALPARLFRRLLQLQSLLDSQAPNCLHLFILTPSREYWADLQVRSRTRHRGSGIATIAGTSDPDFHPGGLLWAFGRYSQDLQRQIADTLLGIGDGGIDLSSDSPPQSLLGRLQASCRASTPVPPDQRDPISPDDVSLTVHATHTTLRELEVCRDRILQALIDLKDLRHEQILILLANPKAQTLFLEAALGSDAESRLPFRLAGSSESVPSPFASTLIRLIETFRGRLTLDRLQALIENPMIADRFELEERDSDGLRLVDWLSNAGFRWGVSSEHRRTFQAISEDRWNLLWALQRLGLGGVVEEGKRDSILHLPHLPTDLVPLERASGLGLVLLAKLARLVKAIEQAQKFWSQPVIRTLEAWNQALRKLVVDFTQTKDHIAAQHSTTLQRQILPALQRASGDSIELDASGYLRILSEKLTSLNLSSSRGIGGVQVADLRLYAGVPARMILVVGLDDGTFPRRDDRPDWHPLSCSAATGDPSQRDADRHALLLAILSCSDRLVLSYQGHSDEDAKERPPSTALADLLGAIDQTAVSSTLNQLPHAEILFHHPLNGFAPEAFQSDLPQKAQGKRAVDYKAAQALMLRSGLPAYPGPWSLPLPKEIVCNPTVADLRTLLKEPQLLFTARLGVQLREEPDALHGDDLISPDGLQKWALKDQLLIAKIEGADISHLQGVLHASGKIPRAFLGSDLFDKILDELPETQHFKASCRVTQTHRFLLQDPFNDGDPVWVEGAPRAGWYRQPHSESVFFYSASSCVHAELFHRELHFGFEALALVASQSTQDPHPLKHAVAAFSNKKTLALTLPDPEQARQLLGRLLALHRLAREYPLPFWPKTAAAILKIAPTNPPPSDTLRNRALAKGLLHWTQDSFIGSDAAAKKPASRYTFRGCPDPFDWSPKSLPDWLPFPEAPFAWRTLGFIDAWKNSLNFTKSKDSSNV